MRGHATPRPCNAGSIVHMRHPISLLRLLAVDAAQSAWVQRRALADGVVQGSATVTLDSNQRLKCLTAALSKVRLFSLAWQMRGGVPWGGGSGVPPACLTAALSKVKGLGEGAIHITFCNPMMRGTRLLPAPVPHHFPSHPHTHMHHRTARQLL